MPVLTILILILRVLKDYKTSTKKKLVPIFFFVFSIGVGGQDSLLFGHHYHSWVYHEKVAAKTICLFSQKSSLHFGFDAFSKSDFFKTLILKPLTKATSLISKVLYGHHYHASVYQEKKIHNDSTI